MDRVTLRRLAALWVCASAMAVSAACAQNDDGIQRITRELVPQVERAVGLTFKRPPVVAGRSRDQVRAYLDRKIAAEYPPADMAAVERTYRAFRLVDDTVDLRRLMLDLFAEQVAGYYDPDSSMLFIVRGTDPRMVRFVLAHELVHALQDQYTRLNAILKLRHQNDRQMAGQAVMEGQAVVASLTALAPAGAPPDFAQAWAAIRRGIRDQQASMPVFAAAPRILQESLLFPYVAGGQFITEFENRRARPDEQPFNQNLPISTEQVLHAAKYTAHERPAAIRLAPAGGDTVVYEDDFGEFETRIALETWGASEADAVAAAAGWNGDRYRLLGTPAGTALVWVTAWDSARDADEFEAALRAGWTSPDRAGAPSRRTRIDRFVSNGISAVRLVDAPAAWTGWRRLPGVTVTGRGGE